MRERLISFDIERKVHRFFKDNPEEDYYQSFAGPEKLTDNSVDRFFSI